MTHRSDDGPAASAPLQRLLSAGGPMAMRPRAALIDELSRLERAQRADAEAAADERAEVGPPRRLDGFRMPPQLWARLGIPTGLAYLHFGGPPGQLVATYPSPAGPTHRELELGAWQELVEANPVLASLEPADEALLVDTTVLGAGGRAADTPDPRRYGQASARYAIVPLESCDRLVASLSSISGTAFGGCASPASRGAMWRGSGAVPSGSEVRRLIDAVFADAPHDLPGQGGTP